MTISVTPAPRARSPSTISGVEVVPVTGSVGLSGGGSTATDVTTAALGGVDGGPITGTVDVEVVGVGGRFPTAVLVVEVEPGTVEVVDVEDVEDVGSVVEVDVDEVGSVVEVDVDVVGAVDVEVVGAVEVDVVVGATVVGAVDVDVVVGATVVGAVDVDVVVGAIVVGAVEVDVVVGAIVVGATVVGAVVVGGSVVSGTVVGATVVVVVVVGGGVVGPQNWRLEMSGVLPLPTAGSAAFENEPDVCAGLKVFSTESLPPLMMIAEIGTLDWKEPPVASPLTDTLPLPFSKA
jgi:hypothetical protein